MLVTGIKSMPVYRPLQFDGSGKVHLAVARGAGGIALRRLAGECKVLYAAEAGADLTQAVRESGADVMVAASTAALLEQLGHALASLSMGLRIYAAGDEDFLAQVSRLGERHGLDPAEMQCECVAPGARRVYCVHCRTCNGAVSGGIAPCAGCGRKLLVRDHYSRRLAAFMGVMADAETLGAA